MEMDYLRINSFVGVFAKVHLEILFLVTNKHTVAV